MQTENNPLDNIQINEFKPSIDIDKIIQLINEGQSTISLAVGQCVILVLGSTGSGKSTFSNFMNGRQMELKEIEQEVQRSGQRVRKIQEEFIAVSENDQEDFEIGHNKKSHTLQIKAIQLSTCNFIICDFPGFFDNRSVEHEISNSVCLQKFLENCKSVIPVILINYNDFESERGESFKKLFDLIVNILKETDENSFNKCLFLYTHVPSRQTYKHINSHIIKEQDTLDQECRLQKVQYDLLENLLDQIDDHKNELILNPIGQSYQDYIKLIKSKVPFQHPKEEFSFSLSEKANQTILSYVKDVRQQITNWLIQQQYESIFTLIQSFKKFKELLNDNYLSSAYQDIISQVSESIQNYVNKILAEFSESSQSENFFSKKLIEEIFNIKEKLITIDRFREELLLNLEINYSQFIGQILSICKQVALNCDLGFSENLQFTKDNLQKLLQVSQSISEAIPIYISCKESILNLYSQKNEQFEKIIEQFFQNDYNNIEKLKVLEQIEQIGASLQEFQHIESFLKLFYQEDSNKMDMYGKQINYIKKKCQSQLDNINLSIQQKEQLFNKVRVNFSIDFNQYQQDLPDFEIRTLKLLSSNHSLNQHVKIYDLYEEGKNSIKSFTVEQLKQIQDILEENINLTQIEPLFKSLDQVRNLDESIRNQTLNEYSLLQEQLNKRIISNREMVEMILDKYYQLEEYDDFSDIECKQLNLFTQKQDFKKLSSILQFLKNMSWTDVYFKKNVVSTTINKIKDIISKYMDDILEKCNCLVEENQFKILGQCIMKIEVLKEVQDAIDKFNERKEQSIQNISNRIIQKIKAIDTKFNEMKETRINQKQEQGWKNLNHQLIQLRQIQQLKKIPQIKDDSTNSIQNIIAFLQQYYQENLQSITNNKSIQLIQQVIQNNEISKQIIFVDNVQYICTDCNDLANCFGNNNNFIKIRDSIIGVYESLSQEYQDNLIKQVNPQQQKEEYEIIKQYCIYFKRVQSLQTLYDSFKNIVNPSQIITEKLLNILQQIRRNEFNYIRDAISPLLSLQNEQDRLYLNFIFQEIYGKIKEFINKIEYEFTYHHKLIDREFILRIKESLTLINYIKPIYDQYFKQFENGEDERLDLLFKQLNDKISDFLQNQGKSILLKASKHQFQQMEESYIYLNQLLWILKENQINNHQYKAQELKEQLEITIKNLILDKGKISQPELLKELINSIKESVSSSNSIFNSIFIEVEGMVQGSINKYIQSSITQITELLDQEIFNKSKLELNKLRIYLENIKILRINYDPTFDFQFNEKEEQIQQITQSKVRKIEELLKQGNNEDLIEVLRSQKISDRDLYGQSITQIKTTIQTIMLITSSQLITMDEQEFTKNIQKIFNIYCVGSIDKELSSFFCDQYQLFIEKIQQISNNYLVQAQIIVENNGQNVNDIKISDIFKYKAYLNIILNIFKEENRIKELIKEIDTIIQKLYIGLQILKNEQQEFIKSSGQNPSFKELKQKSNYFEQFIQYLKQDQVNKQYITEQFIKLGQQLQTFQNLHDKIQDQVLDIKNEMLDAWEKEDYQKIKFLISELYQKRIVNQQSNYSESIDINKIIKQIEEKIDRMTKDALTTIHSKKKFDSQFSTLINRIYKAEENLKDQSGLQYKTQSQIELVEQEIIKKIDDIKKKYREKEPDNIISVSKILIKVERIADNVKQFSQISNKKNTQALQNFYKESGNDGIFQLAQILNETSTGRFIVENYSVFKFYKIQQFNETQLQHGEDYVFKHLQSSKLGENPINLKPKTVETLREHLRNYNKIYDQTMKKYILKSEESWQEIVTSAIQIIKAKQVKIDNWNRESKQAAVEVLALICAYWSLSEGALRLQNKKDIKEQHIYKQPTVIQIVSIMMLLGFNQTEGKIKNAIQKIGFYKTPLKNKLIEILTGEGKSLTLGFCSLLLALIGCQVDVVCYSQYLSKRDFDAFLSLFTKFGVQGKIQYCTFKQLCEHFLDQFGSVRDLTTNIIENKSVQNKISQNNYDKRVLLIDEVDVFFNLDFYGQTYNPSTLLYSIEIEQIIRSVWKSKSNSSQTIYQEIINSKPYLTLIQKFPNFSNYFQRQVQELSQCVKQVKNHEETKQFIVKNDKIGYKQKDSSYSFSSSYSYNTLFAYYDKNVTYKQISDQSLKNQMGFSIQCGHLSYALLPNQYSNILGVTGTLKSLNPIVKKALKKYNIQSEIYAPSMYGVSNRKFLPGTMVHVEKDSDNQYLKINSITQAAHQNKQSTLIFFKTKKEISNFVQNNQFLKNINAQIIQLVEGMDISDIDHYVRKSTESKNITLCVREYGRGTDFVCYDPEVLKNNGVVVIQTFLSSDKTEEIQIQGRTARQGNKGEYHLVLSQTDLEQEFSLTSQQINQWKNNQDPSNLYYNLIQIRDQSHNKQYETLDIQICNAESSHSKTLLYYGDLLRGDKQQVINYVNQFG